jgi:hypothetical protein
VAQVGIQHFQILLRRGLYVVYVDREAVLKELGETVEGTEVSGDGAVGTFLGSWDAHFRCLASLSQRLL